MEREAVPVASARGRAEDRAKAALAQQAQQSLRPGGVEGGGLPVGGSRLAGGGGQHAGALPRPGQQPGWKQGGQQGGSDQQGSGPGAGPGASPGAGPGAGQQGKKERPSSQQRGGGKPNQRLAWLANDSECEEKDDTYCQL
jgi:hypothetical protein